MGLLNILKKRSTPAPTDDFWYQTLDAYQRYAGQQVTAQTAQKVAAVYACITAISESFAMLPVSIYSEINEIKKKDDNHYLHELLRDAPNNYQDSFEFFDFMQSSILEEGNAFAQKVQSKTGRIKQLRPFIAKDVEVKITSGGQIGYVRRTSSGSESYTQDEIFHIKNRTKDGIIGITPIKVAAASIAYSLALLDHGNNLFENGAFMSGFIKTAFAFKTNEARDNFMDSFKKWMGVKKAGKVGLLEQGSEWQPMSMNNRDAQFTEAKQLSVVDIARLFRVPPHMIQALDSGMSYSSVEQMSILFVQYTIQPWVTRWERAIKRQLLRGQSDTFARFNVMALIRGDLKARTEAIVQQLQYGLLTINEGRDKLDETRLDDPLADEAMVSHNLRPLSLLLTEPTAPNSGAPTGNNSGADSVKNPENPVKNSKREAFEPLFSDILGRMRRREREAVKSALKNENFFKWAEGFFEKHRALMEEALTPACLAYSSENVEQLRDFVDSYISNLQEVWLSTEPNELHERMKQEIGISTGDLFTFLEREDATSTEEN